MTKVCTKCGQEKDTRDFPNEKKRSDGKYPWCKPCLSEHRKSRYKSVPRKVWIEQKVCSCCKEWKPREEFRKYTGGNLHYRCIPCEDSELERDSKGLCKCSSCNEVKPLNEFYRSRQTKTSKQCIECHKVYTQNPDIKLKRRDYSLRKNFGITLDQYKDLMNLQDNKCPICLEKFQEGNYSYPVDHAHAGPNAGAIRAIVHDRCNRFVLWKHTDPEQLRRAADIIESPLTDWFVPEDMVKGPKKRRKKKVKK